MERKVRIAVAIVAVCVATTWSTAMEAQFLDRLMNPKLNVPVNHAPGLGVQVTKVAFGAGVGAGSDEFIDQLTAKFVAQNVEVLERERLNSLLREQNFSLSGAVDQTSAAALGKILGPTVMVFVTSQRYTTDQKRVFNDWKDRQGRMHRTYIARTIGYVRMSVRSVDLATGRIFAAKVLESTPVLENKIDDAGWPEYPDAYQILDSALASVVRQAEMMYLPWTSTASVYFFDDKDCDLKVAHSRLKTGDIPGTLALSLKNVEACRALTKPNTKALAHAYHNVGTSYFLLGDYPKALENLHLAQSTKESNIYVETIQVVNVAAREAAAQQRVEEQMVIDANQASKQQSEAVAAKEAGTLTNADVIALADAKLPPPLILAKIKSSTCRFETTAKALVDLRSAGVPDDVIMAMMECKPPR